MQHVLGIGQAQQAKLIEHLEIALSFRRRPRDFFALRSRTGHALNADGSPPQPWQ